jgi:hypothetical protein
MERETGIEPATSSLGSWHSTAELLPPSGSQPFSVFRPIILHERRGWQEFPRARVDLGQVYETDHGPVAVLRFSQTRSMRLVLHSLFQSGFEKLQKANSSGRSRSSCLLRCETVCAPTGLARHGRHDTPHPVSREAPRRMLPESKWPRSGFGAETSPARATEILPACACNPQPGRRQIARRKQLAPTGFYPIEITSPTRELGNTPAAT